MTLDPVVQQFLNAVAPLVVTQLAKAGVGRFLRRKLPSWSLPLLSCALGVALSFAPGLDAVGPALGALLGLGGSGLYSAGVRRLPGFQDAS